MPRPLNWTQGEGRYKGLGTLVDKSIYLNPVGAMIFDNSVMYGPPRDPTVPVLDTDQSLQAQVNAINEYLYAGYDWGAVGEAQQASVASNTLGGWIQQNSTLLVIGGIVGLFLFRK
jgi:hypothetical protein